jgi:hypothetical protein
MRNNNDKHDNEVEPMLTAETSSDDSAKLTSERKVVALTVAITKQEQR